MRTLKPSLMPNLSLDDHFKDLFENTSDLIHFLSIDGNIELVNPAWLTTLDYELHEVVDRNIYDFIHVPCIEEYKAARQEAISKKSKVDLVTTFMTKHGKEVVGEGQIDCAYNMNQPLYTRCVFKNITARKIAEKNLRIVKSD